MNKFNNSNKKIFTLFICLLFSVISFAQKPVEVFANSVDNEVSIKIINNGEIPIKILKIYPYHQPKFVKNLKYHSIQEENKEIDVADSVIFRFTFDITLDSIYNLTDKIIFKVESDGFVDIPYPELSLKIKQQKLREPPIFYLKKIKTNQYGSHDRSYIADFNKKGLGATYTYEKKNEVGSEKHLFSLGFTQIPEKIEMGKDFSLQGKYAISLGFTKPSEVPLDIFEERFPCYKNTDNFCLNQGVQSSYSHLYGSSQAINIDQNNERKFTVDYIPIKCVVSFPQRIDFDCKSIEGQAYLRSNNYTQVTYSYRSSSNLPNFQPETIEFKLSKDMLLSSNIQGFIAKNNNVSNKDFVELKKDLPSYYQDFKLKMMGLETKLQYRPLLKGDSYIISPRGYSFPAKLSDNVTSIAERISPDYNKPKPKPKPSNVVKKAYLPNVIGLSYDNAVNTIEQAGLVALTPELGSDAKTKAQIATVEKALAIKQGQLHVGDEIRLFIYGELKNTDSVGNVPDVVGMEVKQASDIVEAAGFHPVFELGKDTNDMYKAQTIASQAPQAGMQIASGKDIHLFVYVLARNTVIMPDLRGLSIAQAKNKLQSVGLSMTAELGDNAPQRSKQGQVYRQYPEANIDISDGAVVNVWIYAEKPETIIASQDRQKPSIQSTNSRTTSGHRSTSTSQGVPFIDLPAISAYPEIIFNYTQKLNGNYTYKNNKVNPGRFYRPVHQFLVTENIKTWRRANFDYKNQDSNFNVNIIWIEANDKLKDSDNFARFCKNPNSRPIYRSKGFFVSTKSPAFRYSSHKGAAIIDIDSNTENLYLSQNKDFFMKMISDLMSNIEPYAVSCSSYIARATEDTHKTNNNSNNTSSDYDMNNIPKYNRCHCRDEGGKPYWVILGMGCGVDKEYRNYKCYD